MAFYQLVYVSLAVRPLQTPELVALLDQSRAHNAANGVTGLLLYHQQDFTQLLEGEQADVQAVFKRICADRRHQQVHVMWERPIRARSFDDWFMAFVAPEEEQLIGHPGYADLRADGLFGLGQLHPTRGQALFKILCEGFLHTA